MDALLLRWCNLNEGSFKIKAIYGGWESEFEFTSNSFEFELDMTWKDYIIEIVGGDESFWISENGTIFCVLRLPEEEGVKEFVIQNVNQNDKIIDKQIYTAYSSDYEFEPDCSCDTDNGYDCEPDEDGDGMPECNSDCEDCPSVCDCYMDDDGCGIDE